MRHRKLTGLIVSLALTLSMSTTIFAAPAVTDAAADTSPIVILHTNDVHCGIDDSIGYAGLAAYKSEMEAQYGADRVTLVDAGDAIQGGAVGTLSDGAYVIDIMNQVTTAPAISLIWRPTAPNSPTCPATSGNWPRAAPY